MACVNADYSFLDVLSSLSTDYPADYRTDGRCGPEYPGPNGEEGICLKDGEFPCCSTAGWCGNTNEHCEEKVHRDYSIRDGVASLVSRFFARP